MNRFTIESASQCHAMALTVEALRELNGAEVEFECSGPSEWRAVWQCQHPRELLVLGTFYVEQAVDARAALNALVGNTLNMAQ